jgi:hypothetical protein
MEILKDFLTNNSPALVNTLSEAGFSAQQAEEFIPEVGQSVQDAFSGGDLISLLGGSDTDSIVNTLLEKVDIETIANKLGLDESMVSSGVETLIPKVMELINQDGGGLSSLLGGEGGLLGGIARLGSRLFKQ